MIIHLIYWYFLANAVILGYELSTSIFKRDGKLKYIVNLVLCTLFGFLIYFIAFILDLFKYTTDYLDRKTLLIFYFKFYFTKEFKNMSEESFERVKNACLKYKNLRSKRNIKALKMIYKRHNREFETWMN